MRLGSFVPRITQRVYLPIKLPFRTATLITVPAGRNRAIRSKRTRRVRDVLAKRLAGQVFPAHLTVIRERTGARTSRVRTRAPRAVTLPARRITGKGYISNGRADPSARRRASGDATVNVTVAGTEALPELS